MVGKGKEKGQSSMTEEKVTAIGMNTVTPFRKQNSQKEKRKGKGNSRLEVT